nr:hypothetical protein [Leptospira fletcheri]
MDVFEVIDVKNPSFTPTQTVNMFIRYKKEGNSVPLMVWDSLRNYQKWNQIELTGLLNASGYFPDILFEPGMEEKIQTLLQDFQKRTVEIPIR